MDLIEFLITKKLEFNPRITIALCLAGFITFAFIVMTVGGGLIKSITIGGDKKN